MEEDGEWSLLVGDPGELDELAETGSSLYVGDRLPPQVYQDPELAWYQQQDDGWQPGGDENGWWSESGWNETTWWTDPHEHEELSPEEQQEVDEAFAAAEQKVGGFVQARQAIKARNLSRGFYSYNPSAKGGRARARARGPASPRLHRPPRLLPLRTLRTPEASWEQLSEIRLTPDALSVGTRATTFDLAPSGLRLVRGRAPAEARSTLWCAGVCRLPRGLVRPA